MKIVNSSYGFLTLWEFLLSNRALHGMPQGKPNGTIIGKRGTGKSKTNLLTLNIQLVDNLQRCHIGLM